MDRREVNREEWVIDILALRLAQAIVGEDDFVGGGEGGVASVVSPRGTLQSLPLHAMGPIESEDCEKHGRFNRVIMQEPPGRATPRRGMSSLGQVRHRYICLSDVHLAEVKEKEAATVTVYTGANDDLQVINSKIEWSRALSLLHPRPHPLRSCIIAHLGLALYHRYLISGQEDDLLAAIPLFTEALLLRLVPEQARLFPNTDVFYALACSLASRFQLHLNSQDFEQAVRYYRHMLTLPPGAINSLPVLVGLTKLLVEGVRHREKGGGVESDLVEEMVRILQRTAARDPSSKYLKPIAQNIGHILVAWLIQTDRIAECEQVLSLFSKVEELCSPELSLEFYVNQGITFATCFRRTGLYDYSEQAIVRLNKVLALLAPEHPLRPCPQTIISTVLLDRFCYNTRPEYLEEAIRHSRAALTACLPGHPLRPGCLERLSDLLSMRDAFFGNAEFLEEANAYIHDAHSEEIPEHLRAVADAFERLKRFNTDLKRDNSLEALEEEIRRQRERLERIPAGHPDYLNALRSLALACGSKFERTFKLADLEEEINYHAIALAASPPNHYLRRDILFNLVNSCLLCYMCGKTTMHHLDYSIMYCRDLLELCPHGHMIRSKSLQYLAGSLATRYLVLHRRADLDESMTLFQSASEEEHTDPHTQYKTATLWAMYARQCQHPSTTLAYEKAISLMQTSLAVGPTLEMQHRLTGKWAHFIALPLQCASYYIEMGSFESAVEILERGRALLWSEMRGLRTPFVAVSEQLENIVTSAQAPGIGPLAGDTATLDDHPDYSRPDVFSQMMENVRVLERKRGEVIDQIRLVPGFADFLKAVPFGTLQTAAACGPVIIINHCFYRSDILIVLHDSAPVLIPTTEDCFTRAAELKQLLLETRTQYPLESTYYERALRFVLQELYNLVGRPVIEKLRELGIPEQSRVWWCPTSVFFSLPLHAMGPIESEDCEKQYFSDLYVSSYTPSLSVLIESRKGIVANSGPPSLLIVGQTDPSLQGVRGEIKVIQRHAPLASTLIGAKATRARVIKHLAKHQMVHFACHGKLAPERPFETGFLLHGNERLTLLDIVRSKLSTAQCAFLSVCHAAEWTDEDTPDEALHLAAAMQYCGFRSVVGTLWAMADMDGRDLAGQFYGIMFGEDAEERGMGIGERSARALRDAVQMLRRKSGITLERWVNFVHYGG
ncbi:CHAT domain-containing protein [Russula dissimulans]|nr:CHAT domain-containing protein [Russula dissimulans]